MASFPDMLLAYGQSDEYSFVFKKDCQMYSRRAFKVTSNKCNLATAIFCSSSTSLAPFFAFQLTSNIVSLFASSYVFDWPNFFPDTPLKYPPSFDSRAVPYPTNRDLRNYLSWRQVSDIQCTVTESFTIMSSSIG